MRLLVISHTSHYWKDGTVVGWGPTVREIDQLASIFDEVVHVAFLYDGAAPASALAYEARNVVFVPLPPTGGTTLAKKIGVLRAWPAYLGTILKKLPRCDVVHVRCPSSIGLLTIVVLALAREPRVRWIKYAGNWQVASGQPWSYRLQRWLLKRTFHRACVTINGEWPDQPAHVRSFFNPCLTDDEVREGALIGGRKELGSRLQLLFVGRLEEGKGCAQAIDVVADLRNRDINAALDVVGDGPDRARLQSRVATAGLRDSVRFLGWVPRHELNQAYAAAHVLLFPSTSEGWPKVLSEGMAYGVVPVTSDVSTIPQYLGSFRMGRALDPADRNGFVEAIAGYWTERGRWKAESQRAIEAAGRFTYGRYLAAVRGLLGLEVA